MLRVVPSICCVRTSGVLHRCANLSIGAASVDFTARAADLVTEPLVAAAPTRTRSQGINFLVLLAGRIFGVCSRGFCVAFLNALFHLGLFCLFFAAFLGIPMKLLSSKFQVK